MNNLIFRNDDVSASSDMESIFELYDLIWKKFPDAIIWSGVSVFSRGRAGSVYPELPLKVHPTQWFYNADRMWRWVWEKMYEGDKHKIVSHGLYHVDHSQLSKDAQVMSILGSCKFLNTDIFIPPYGRGNTDTIDICRGNGLQLVMGDEWRSMKHYKFDPNYKKWYFHSWRWTLNRMKEQLG